MIIQDLLQKHKLRVTQPRILVLQKFHTRLGRGISSIELLESFKGQIDKVTLYRTLHTFEEKHLIHRIFDNSNIEKYALCIGTCATDGHHYEHDHTHVHFKCDQCDQTECLADAILPQIALPLGYIHKKSNFVINGLCENCSG